MSFNPKPKPGRIIDISVINEIRDKHCCCLVGFDGRFGKCSDSGIDMHHIISRGSGGGDVKGNLIRLCRHHHQMCHNALISKKILYEILDKFGE
jgi:5-methylcytosine-specific restriction endonuclease McrA